MNVSYRWLRTLIPDLRLSPEEMAETLALRGAPVEELVHLAPGLEGLVVGRVEAVEPHPNADRLSVCRVDAGAEPVQVVCGAPVIQVGGYYPFAPPGVRLPTGVKLRKVTLRGVESHGMLCSETELEMGPDDEGIMLLEGEFTPGEPLAQAMGLDDWRLDVEITPNRGDLLSHVGVVRELAPPGEEGVHLPPIPGAPEVPFDLETGPREASAGGVRVEIQDPDLCSRYLGAVIRGVKVGPSPAWLAARIRAAGSRPINNVVDATNYVLLELGQPLHAFDLAKLEGSAIVVRRAKGGESIRTLDGEDRRLTADMLAICDASDPVAIAGVMGGADSEVSEETTDILLECALFHPKSVRGTRSALDMSTDASFRFERGVDPEGMETAVRRALEIILATAGGTPDPRVLDACPEPWRGLTVSLRPARVEKLLGVEIPEETLGALLTPLGFRVLGSTEGSMEVAVPGFRSYDVRREVDLVEEVARTYGYDRFPEELGPFRPGTVPDHPLFQLEDDLRDILVGEGFFEAQNMAFAAQREGEVELSNPISVQEAFLRTALLPGLLRRVEYNFARGQRDVRLFELGNVFLAVEGEETPGTDPVAGGEGAGQGGRGAAPPLEETRLCVVATGDRARAHWSTPSVSVDLWDLKGLMARLIPGARLLEASLREGVPEGSGLIPDEGLSVVDRDGRVLGYGGRVEPAIVDSPAWAGPVVALELTLPSNPAPRPTELYRPPPAFPGVDRDLALLIPKGLPARQVEEAISESGGGLLVEVGVFDLYEGEGVPEGHRSVAFRLRYQSGERTLTDKDVDRSVKAVTDRLREEFGVEPRG